MAVATHILARASALVAGWAIAAMSNSAGSATRTTDGICGRAAPASATSATAIATAAHGRRIQTDRCSNASRRASSARSSNGRWTHGTKPSAIHGALSGVGREREGRRQSFPVGVTRTRAWARSRRLCARAGMMGGTAICASTTWPCSASTSAISVVDVSTGSASVSLAGGASTARLRILTPQWAALRRQRRPQLRRPAPIARSAAAAEARLAARQQAVQPISCAGVTKFGGREAAGVRR